MERKEEKGGAPYAFTSCLSFERIALSLSYRRMYRDATGNRSRDRKGQH